MSSLKKIKEKGIIGVLRYICDAIWTCIMDFVHRVFCFGIVDQSLIVFQSEGDFTDNSRALYEYLKKTRPQYHYAWLVQDKSLFTNDKKTVFVNHNYRIMNIHAAYVLAKARYVFYTHGIGSDIYRRKGQTIVNLWHGTPIKGVRVNEKNRNPEKTDFDYLIGVGDLSNKGLAKFIQCSERFIVTLGCPRYDLLLDSQSEGCSNPFVPNNFKGKVVLWMPTFRASVNKALSEESCDTETGLPMLETLSSLSAFNKFLGSVGMIVIIKIHHLQADKDVFKKEFSNIVFLTDGVIQSKGFQLYEIIGKSDALLTDYSSVYIDYMLLNKPIGFTINDLDEYESSRGQFLYPDIKSMMPGRHISSLKQLEDFFMEIYEGKDETKKLRDNLIDSMIKYQDNKNCERVVDYFNL